MFQFKNVHADNNEVSEENSNEQENINSVEISNGEEENNNREQENNNGEQNSLEANNTEQCNGEKPKGDCLFGCDDNGVSQYTNDEKETKPANLEDMMKTFEETEKICEVIERKDKERRDREAVENLEKQLELNKKFLVQQKAQNKQIEDLQGLVKAMQFDEDMKKVAIEKCSGKADDCLSDKEKEMSKILQMREARKQNMKINLNIDPFGEEFKKKLMESLKLPEGEISKLLAALKKEISVSDLVNNGNSGNSSMDGNNKGIDGKGTKNSKGYDESCPNCKVDLSEYIDKCKIPCKSCRDPA